MKSFLPLGDFHLSRRVVMALGGVFLLAAAYILYGMGGTAGLNGRGPGPGISAAKIPARRVVSLAPSITEILFELGAEAGGNGKSANAPLQLVGRTRFCTHPTQALAVPEVGGLGDPSIERLLSIRPDLIVATSLTSPDVMDQLRNVGFSTLVVKHEGVQGILRDIQTIGDAVGKSQQATQLVASLEARLEKLKVNPTPAATSAASGGAGRIPKVLFLYDADGLYSAGPHSFASELVALAGGNNLGDKATSAWPQLSMEFILASKPDVIVVTGPNDDEVAESGPSPSAAGMEERLTMQKELIEKWRADARWRELEAVRAGRVVVIPGMPFTVPGPRMVDGVEILSRALGFSRQGV